MIFSDLAGPPMQIRRQLRARGYGAFAGEWEDYCSKTYSSDPENLARCNSKPAPCLFGVCPPFMAPWTVAGKAARGLPSLATDVINASSSGAGTPVTTIDVGQSSVFQGGSAEGLFGLPKYAVIGGAAILGLGLFLKFGRKGR